MSDFINCIYRKVLCDKLNDNLPLILNDLKYQWSFWSKKFKMYQWYELRSS